MEPNTPETTPTDPPGRGLLVVAGLVLIALTLWVFTENTSSASSDAAGRVNPGDAYDPVAAGERLPDGFRQLLPRDAIQPVYDPTFLAASATSWPDATHVIGVALGDGAKAYPVSFLNGRELVVDELDGIPLLVSW